MRYTIHMRYSELFGKTSREAPRDEESVNAQLLIRGGFVDKLQAGVYTFLPLGLRVLKKIENIIREEMISLGGQEVLMPTLHPKANWDITGRYNDYDSLFRFESYYSKQNYILGPTHEEIISPLVKKRVSSHTQLPLYLFQIQNKFRDEKRAKSGLLRGREFFMKDLYSFHADEHDLDLYYEKVKDVYTSLFKRIGIGDQTYLTYASGGTFAKYSHEFQTLTNAGEDHIFVCEPCKTAINREIIQDVNACPNCGRKDLVEKQAIEVGNIFKLKTKYSTPFELAYTDKDGTSQDVMMGCYGIGLNRLVGTVVEVFHDESGIVWPKSVAPFQVHLIGIDLEKGEKLYRRLISQGVEVLYDDRDVRAGEKFADSDLLGIPTRIVVSAKTGDQIEIKKRSEQNAELIDEGKISEFIS